jgi:hypothetical protein
MRDINKKKPDSVLIGGSIIPCMLIGNKDYNDIDVYVSREYADIFIRKYLELHPNYKYSIPYSAYRGFGMENSGVRTVINSSESIIEIIVVETQPKDIILNSFLTCCRAYFDGTSLTAPYLHETLEKKCILIGDYVKYLLVDNKSLSKHINKYIERGFDISVSESSNVSLFPYIEKEAVDKCYNIFGSKEFYKCNYNKVSYDIILRSYKAFDINFPKLENLLQRIVQMTSANEISPKRISQIKEYCYGSSPGPTIKFDKMIKLAVNGMSAANFLDIMGIHDERIDILVIFSAIELHKYHHLGPFYILYTTTRKLLQEKTVLVLDELISIMLTSNTNSLKSSVKFGDVTNIVESYLPMVEHKELETIKTSDIPIDIKYRTYIPKRTVSARDEGFNLHVSDVVSVRKYKKCEFIPHELPGFGTREHSFTDLPSGYVSGGEVWGGSPLNITSPKRKDVFVNTGKFIPKNTTATTGKFIPKNTTATASTGKFIPKNTTATTGIGKFIPKNTTATTGIGKFIPKNTTATASTGKFIPKNTTATASTGKFIPKNTTASIGKFIPKSELVKT